MNSSTGGKASSERFLADAMLGKLSRWLRFFGYDVEYVDSSVDDDEIIRKCYSSNLILITMDVDLSRRVKGSILLGSFNTDVQLRTLLEKFPIGDEWEMTRCPVCNGRLAIKREADGDSVPEAVSRKFNEFWVCSACGRVHWKGSHYDRIKKKLAELKEM
ncbi:hypothetical protein Thermo_00654 [Thermoplasmatales archaeon]|nr:hypothetical protein Thermo_00654 [Thermoplasmatales archaeon]